MEGVARTRVNALGKRPEHIHIIIDGVEPGNWAAARMLATEYHRSQEESA